MKRLLTDPRPNWHQSISEQGLLWHTDDDPFWNEGVYYDFTFGEIEFIEEATEELYAMCLEAAQHMMDTRTDAQLHLPDGSLARMKESFTNHRTDTIYARFDLCYDAATDTIKMYEINGDTPTMLVESAVAQWMWKEDVFGDARDQFNSIHERLIRGWRNLSKRHMFNKNPHSLPTLSVGVNNPKHITFVGALELIEEAATLAYLADTAEQAGLTTSIIDIEDVGLDEANQFIDDGDDVLGLTFKLYPTEDMLASPFGEHMERNSTVFIEPVWKQALSHKALLASLWECYPNHRLLLPASLDESAISNPLPKPFFGREGEGMRGEDLSGYTNGHASPGMCYQSWHSLPEFDGHFPVIGSWVIDGEAAGMGIRETSQPITDGTAQFVPHVINTPAPSAQQQAEWLRQG